MDIGDKIEQELKNSMKIEKFEVKDFTGRHLNHEQHDGGFHLEAVIVSDEFLEQSLIERHKMVYTALGDLMNCLLYTSPSPRDRQKTRMPSSA